MAHGATRVLVGLPSVLALAAWVGACSRPSVDPLHYDHVVTLVQSIAYEPDLLGDLLGRRVSLDLRPFAVSDGYYVEESQHISFRCRTQDSEFRGGVAVVATVVDLDSSPSGVTTITLDSCGTEHKMSSAAAVTPGR